MSFNVNCVRAHLVKYLAETSGGASDLEANVGVCEILKEKKNVITIQLHNEIIQYIMQHLKPKPKAYVILTMHFLANPVLGICSLMQHITKTRLYNLDPLKPHFCIVKLGFTGVYIIFLISSRRF